MKDDLRDVVVTMNGVELRGYVAMKPDGALVALPIPPLAPVSAVFVLPGGGRVRVTSDGSRTVTTDVTKEFGGDMGTYEKVNGELRKVPGKDRLRSEWPTRQLQAAMRLSHDMLSWEHDLTVQDIKEFLAEVLGPDTPLVIQSTSKKEADQ